MPDIQKWRIEVEKLMTQDKQNATSSAIGVECAEDGGKASDPNGVLPIAGDQWSPVLRIKRLFDPCDDGKASFLGVIASSRLLKFLVVGGIGLFVNLGIMALLIGAGFSGDWRTSVIASVAGALNNYFLNNHWTFSDRRRNGRALFNGAFLYLPMSAVAISVTTVAYSILSQARFRSMFGTSSLYLLGAQLVSILCGTYFNYNLNKMFTWRLDRNQLQ
jgi:putative flippase GtrA